MSATRLIVLLLTASVVLAFGCLVVSTVNAEESNKPSAEPSSPPSETVRIAAVQTKRRVVDWHLREPTEVLAAIDGILKELEQIVDRAGEQACDVVVFPEDTLGLLNWYGMNEDVAPRVVPEAVSRMLDRLGRAAARHDMYLVVCSDHIETDGNTYNTAFLLDRMGHEIGRYHKTCPTWSERGRRSQGKSLPVFETPDLGTAGMLICYDLVSPETARLSCLSRNWSFPSRALA